MTMRMMIDPKKFLRGLVPMPIQELPEDWSIDGKCTSSSSEKVRQDANKKRKGFRRYERDLD